MEDKLESMGDKYDQEMEEKSVTKVNKIDYGLDDRSDDSIEKSGFGLSQLYSNSSITQQRNENKIRDEIDVIDSPSNTNHFIEEGKIEL